MILIALSDTLWFLILCFFLLIFGFTTQNIRLDFSTRLSQHDWAQLRLDETSTLVSVDGDSRWGACELFGVCFSLLTLNVNIQASRNDHSSSSKERKKMYTTQQATTTTTNKVIWPNDFSVLQLYSLSPSLFPDRLFFSSFRFGFECKVGRETRNSQSHDWCTCCLVSLSRVYEFVYMKERNADRDTFYSSLSVLWEIHISCSLFFFFGVILAMRNFSFRLLRRDIATHNDYSGSRTDDDTLSHIKKKMYNKNSWKRETTGWTIE